MKTRTSSSMKRSQIGFVIAVVAIGAAILLLAGEKDKVSSAPLRPEGPAAQQAPEFSLPLLGGGTAALSSFRGKVVILDFWASWCPPCKREIPDFVELQRRYGGQGLQVVGVALDRPEPVRDFAASANINYPVLIGNDEIARLYGGITGIPTTFVIDRQGNIVKRYEGYRPAAVFESDISSLL